MKDNKISIENKAKMIINKCFLNSNNDFYITLGKLYLAEINDNKYCYFKFNPKNNNQFKIYLGETIDNTNLISVKEYSIKYDSDLNITKIDKKRKTLIDNIKKCETCYIEGIISNDKFIIETELINGFFN